MKAKEIEDAILEIVGRKRVRRADIIPAYRGAIAYDYDTSANIVRINWGRINRGILKRFTPSSLMFIKTQAWKTGPIPWPAP